MSEHESDSNVATFIGISLVFALALFFGTTEIYGNDFNGDGKTEMLDVAWMIPVFPIIAFVFFIKSTTFTSPTALKKYLPEYF